MNILFLGNSLVFYNDMPSIFRELAIAGGQDVKVESVTRGSATMSHFASETEPLGIRTREVLASGHWDYVIIEPSRRITPFEDTVMEEETKAARLRNLRQPPARRWRSMPFGETVPAMWRCAKASPLRCPLCACGKSQERITRHLCGRFPTVFPRILAVCPSFRQAKPLSG